MVFPPAGWDGNQEARHILQPGGIFEEAELPGTQLTLAEQLGCRVPAFRSRTPEESTSGSAPPAMRSLGR
jgi:hypothetical protein